MRLRSILSKALPAALSLSLVCAAAFGQAAPPAAQPPSPTAKATAAPSARASAAPSSAASTSPSASASAAPSGSASAQAVGELPPGHPPTGDLPPGHPPAGGGDPHAGGRANPHGGGGRGDLFQAPEDTAEDDPSLPVGTVVVSLRDAEERPIPRADVTLGILHNTVAAGESREKKTGQTDELGNFTWRDLARGSGTSYRASHARGPATFGTDPFTLGDRTGKRVVLHVYEVTNDIEEALVGTQGLVYLALREDSIVFEHLYSIWNLGSVAWVPSGASIDLPEDYKAFNRPDAMDSVGIDDISGKGVLRGTVGPGRHDVQFRYQVPLEGDERQTIKINLPPHVAQMRVMVEASKTMGVTIGPRELGFPEARKTRNRDGKRVLVTEKMVSREGGGLKSMEITLSGLPTAGPSRWVAALGALAAVIGALIYVQMRREQDGPDEETRRDLLDAREALLREIVELTRAHKAGEIGPKTYDRVRNALLDALDRLQAKIAQATPKRPARARVADADESEA